MKFLAEIGLDKSDVAITQDPPFGWSWIVEGIGLTADAYSARTRTGGEPQVVRFLCPPLWSLTLPNIDYNGASGTVSINDYSKGDAATVFIDYNFKGDLTKLKKKDFELEVYKAITLKGSGMIPAQDCVVEKISNGDVPGYKIVKFRYVLTTRAGFEIARDGIAAFSQVGPAGHLQIFWSGVVSTRVEKELPELEQIVRSFRIANVPEGKKIGLEKEFKDFDTNFRVESGKI